MTQIRLPYSRYIDILCLTNVPDDTVIDSFIRRSLRAPTVEHLNEVRLALFGRMPIDVQSYYVAQPGIIDLKKVSKEANEFLTQQGFRDVLENNEAFVAAKVAFDNVDIRVMLYTHIINGEPEDRIKKTFKQMTKYAAHKDLLPMFKKYFCDMFYMDYVAWKEYIVELREVNPFEYDIYRTCFDTRFPFDLVRWKIHADLTEQDPDQLLEKMVTYTYYKALELMEAGVDTDYEMVHGWIEKFVKTYGAHKQLGRGKPGNEGDRGLIEDAVFRLEQVKHSPKNVKEFGENIKRIAAPVVVDIKSERK